MALYALHLDMMSNVSCKNAARNRMREIENEIRGRPYYFPDLQYVLDTREKYKLEKILKKFWSAGEFMILCVSALFIGWIVYFIWHFFCPG
jgi:hypothetical protein